MKRTWHICHICLYRENGIIPKSVTMPFLVISANREYPLMDHTIYSGEAIHLKIPNFYCRYFGSWTMFGQILGTANAQPENGARFSINYSRPVIDWEIILKPFRTDSDLLSLFENSSPDKMKMENGK